MSLKNDPRDGSKFEINNFFNQVALELWVLDMILIFLS